MYDITVWIWIGWITLPLVYLLARHGGPLIFSWFLVQALFCSIYSLTYFTHGDTWVSVGIPGGIFLAWVVYQTQKEWKEISRKE